VDACKALLALDAVRDRLGRVSARPFNMASPKSSLWWLIPPDEEVVWPAHRLGKVAFEFGEAPDTLDVALYVERGLSAEAASALGERPNRVLTNDWMWPRFVEDLRSGRLMRVARSVAEAAQLDVYIQFVVGPESEVAYFKASEPLIPDPDVKASKLLRPFRNVTNHGELVTALDKIDRYTWIVAWVGATFGCTPRAQTQNVWDADRLWSDLLAPFVPWLG
jgi:hypothetical protein